MYTSSQVAERIKKTAHDQGFLVKDILVTCQLNKNTLSSMKAGGYFPRMEGIVAIAEQLGCSVDYLLGRTDDPALSQLDLTDDEYQRVIEYARFLKSQREQKDSSSSSPL